MAKQVLIALSIVILVIGCRQTERVTSETSATVATVETVDTSGGAPPPTETTATGISATTETSATTATTTMPVPGKETHVRLTEYRIEMPDSLAAGPTTFHVMNEGKEKHSFEIEGGGMERALATELAPGATGTLQVDLRPGTYRVYCPVDDHATEHGMTRQLTVR